MSNDIVIYLPTIKKHLTTRHKNTGEWKKLESSDSNLVFLFNLFNVNDGVLFPAAYLPEFDQNNMFLNVEFFHSYNKIKLIPLYMIIILL